jgi:alpha-L-fucosidase
MVGIVIVFLLNGVALGAKIDTSGAPIPKRTLTAPQPALANDPGRTVADGPFKPTWASLAAQYQTPDWFRNAKFGIWAHWSAQCQPEQGDWYAKNMYIEGSKDYAFQVTHYGHPSVVGFKDIDHLWHAENWDPEKLMALYVKAGAHYFVALANHHDNFDCWDSKYQPWNSVNVGPHKDIVGTWAALARKNGLYFGVSDHSSHAWHWFQRAYGYDTEGPEKNVPYDGWLTKADGKGQWWDGLDPQDLYCGPRFAPPPGLDTAAMAAWWKQHDSKWHEEIPPEDNGYTDKWYLRTQDLVDKYHPDLLYFDDTELPLEQAGLDIAADFYNSNLKWNGGKSTAVINAKKLMPDHKSALVEDLERGVSDKIQPLPWQTDTCIGNWHYDAALFTNHKYKKVPQVVQMLCDIVSKNGNLLLNIPLKGDGTIDSDEEAFLHGMADWMAVNAEGIFDTRPWKISGEGPPAVAGGMFNENKQHYTAADVRFTTKGDHTLYAFFFGWPKDGKLTIHTLGHGGGYSGPLDKAIDSVSLLGSNEKIAWTQDQGGLHVSVPGAAPSVGACALRIALE